MFYYQGSLKEVKIGNSLRVYIGTVNSNRVPLAYFMVQTSKEKAIKSACCKTKSIFFPLAWLVSISYLICKENKMLLVL